MDHYFLFGCAAALAFLATLFFTGTAAKAARVPLASLDLSHVRQGWGKPNADQSVDGHPITIGGETFDSGLGTHADSLLVIDLGGHATRFTARVGLDDEVNADPKSKDAAVRFVVYGDEKKLFDSGTMKVGDAARAVDVDLNGVKILSLHVGPTAEKIDFAHADWADANIEMNGDAKPKAIDRPGGEKVVLTPPPPAAPRITGPRVFGVRPGHPVLFTVTATGDGPITFAADTLPSGLSLDAKTGRLTGRVADAGTREIKLTAKSDKGTDARTLKLVVGDALALTPPMGWNSWNVFGVEVTDRDVRAAADALVSSGLAAHGWTYVNIDDAWQAGRDEQGNILPNDKFPDMRALADYVHSKGLKIGLYSSPGPNTCGGYTGSYQHEAQDAKQYAAWGFDYLKYDWCGYEKVAPDHSLPELKKPYAFMEPLLKNIDRDIVYSLCQYGWGDVWKWGPQVGGNCWRTTGDINDTWGSMSGIGFGQAGLAEFASPGHWNDPDMLVVGVVGWGHAHPTRLTPAEQYTHISLWSLLSAPLLIGCDLTRLDDFTKGLLTNDEVLAVNQDSLGKQATRLIKDGEIEVWAKPLADGTTALGVFNRGFFEAKYELDLSKLGDGRTVRDLWRQTDLGAFDETFETAVPPHGVVLLKVSRP